MSDGYIQAEMPRLGKISIRRAVPVSAAPQAAQSLLRACCRRQWSRPRLLPGDASPIASVDEERTCHLDGFPARRLVVTLRPAGCGWGARGGGCVMCGHYLASAGRALSSQELAPQWAAVVHRLTEGRFPVLCAYNGGNLLNPNEVEFSALLDLSRRLAGLPFFRRLVLETRPEFVKSSLVEMLLSALTPSQSLMLGLGVETSNDAVRQLCLNKGLLWSDYAAVPRSSRCLLRFYCFFGAPFLTEAEMLTDTFDSILRFRESNADEIYVEGATIQRGTLLNRLWRNDLYDLPSLWSLIFLLRALPAGPRPYVGAFQHFPMPYQVPQSCGRCQTSVGAALETYNQTLDLSCFDSLTCTCLDSWWQRLQEADARPLEERVLSCLGQLNHDCPPGVT